MATDGESTGPGEVGANEAAYHVELRQFPHSFCRFNLGEQELLTTIVEPWAREEWIELGERKWNPHEAKLKVIEGRRLAVQELSMGRGWRAAERNGREVTEAMLAAIRARLAAGEAAARAATAPDTTEAGPSTVSPRGGMEADSLGLELLAALAAGEAPLRRAWELARARHPERRASECLALAEGAVGSLLRSRLIVLIVSGEGDGGAAGVTVTGEAELTSILRAIESWSVSAEGELQGAQGVWLRRA